MNTVYWVILCFFSASIPWSLIVGYLFTNQDIRSVGDNNPGGTNTLKLAGIKLGLLAIFLDIFKSFLPIYLALHYGVDSWALVIISVSAIIGSIFSPFLKFKGGKSLSVSCGIWMAISSGIVGPIICIMMAFSHLIQKVHIWTIILGWIGILLWAILFSSNLEIILLWIINFLLVMYKHKSELRQRIIFREWIIGNKV
tara:strand:+ start:2724 stop:3317 length:594 start_codon:yes stop_codon:yes gene_type:complete